MLDKPEFSDLIARRRECLQAMRANVLNEAAFNAASREEAELCARIRRLRNADCIQNPEICR